MKIKIELTSKEIQEILDQRIKDDLDLDDNTIFTFLGLPASPVIAEYNV